MLMLFAQGVNGIEYTVSGGGSDGGSTVSTSLEAAKEAAVNSEIAINGADLRPSTSVRGKVKAFEQTHTATDKSGKTASTYVKVVNAPSDLSYSSVILPVGVSKKKTVPWVSAEQWLSVSKADSVIAKASASYAGMSADVGLEMYKGSLPTDFVTLTNYYGKAYASDGTGSDNPYPYGVGAIQTADSGSADSIRLYNHANDGSGLLSIDTYLTGKSGAPASFTNLAALSQAGTDTKVTQKAHVTGDFTSTATSGTDSITRTSDYGNEYDLDMQAVKGSAPTGILGFYVDPSMANLIAGKGAIEGAVSVAQSGDTINAASGSYTDNLLQSSFENIKLVGAGADTTHTASFTLNKPLDGMITGITGDTVNVADPNAKIQDGIDLVTQNGLVNVGAGKYDEDVNINKDLTLKGSGDPTANSFSLTNGAILGTGSGGITALKTIVNEGSKIQDGITLVSENGEVDVNAGTYDEDVDINKDLTLVGNGNPTATSFTLNAKLGTGSGGITAPTVNVNPAAKIQDGITLAKSGGTVNVAAGSYAEDVDINKDITLKGEGEATTTSNSFSLTNGAILGTGSGDISAPTVTVNPYSKILDGILLSSKDVYVNGATGYAYSDDLNQDFYEKGIILTGINNPVTKSISLDHPIEAGKMNGILTNTVNVLNHNAKIQDGVNLVSSGGTVNVAADTYYENILIDKSLTVAGTGAGNTIVDGSLGGSVFRVGWLQPNIDVSLLGMTIQGGTGTEYTGGFIAGGGIWNAGRLTVRDSIISGNTAIQGGGGGIYNGRASTAKTTVIDSIISGNTARYGGGIENDDWGTVTVSGSTISGNTAKDFTPNTNGGSGGGIFNNAGTITVSDSTISGNDAWSGGGIWNYPRTNTKMTITGSKIIDNTGYGGAGGILNQAELDVVNSDISGNHALGGSNGGGIANFGTATITGSTISGNTAYDGAGLWNIGSGHTLKVTSSKIFGNVASHYGGGIRNDGGDTATTKVILIGTEVTGNSASVGGGIYNSYGTTTMDGSEISGNTGGGIRNYNGVLEFTNPSDGSLQVFGNTPYNIQ